MNTVFSNIANAKITETTLNTFWMELFKSSDEILMATGYVSNDAIIELLDILPLLQAGEDVNGSR